MSAPDRMRGLAGKLVVPATAGRLPWLAARRHGLGASETAAVLGLNTWKTPLDVWLEKIDTTPVVDDPPSLAARIGTAMEHVVAQMTVHGWPDLGKIGPTPGLIAHDDHPWMLATVDRLLYERGVVDGPPLGILEVKTTNRHAYEHHWIDGVPPLFVQVQVQQQLAVTGLERAWVACWVRDERGDDAIKAPALIEAAPDVHRQLVEYGGAFWRDHVEARVMPSPIVGDADKMSGLWTPDPAKTVTADEDLEHLIGEWMHADEVAKDAAKRAAALKVQVQARMGEATAIARPDGRNLVTWKAAARTAIDTKALKANDPETAAKYTTTTYPRTFRATKGADE